MLYLYTKHQKLQDNEKINIYFLRRMETRIAETEWLSNRCRRIKKMINPTSAIGDSQILSSQRRDVTKLTLMFRNSMLCNTSLSHKPRWQQ